MPASPEQLKEARKKAVKSPRIGKRGKSKSTLAREKLDEHYEQQIREYWEDIVEIHRKEAAKAKNFAERKMVIEQIRGKAKEKVELTGEVTLRIDV